MLYCIVNLVTKHVEEPLECLCNLLKTVGKELEQVNFYFIMLIRHISLIDNRFSVNNVQFRQFTNYSHIIDLRS